MNVKNKFILQLWESIRVTEKKKCIISKIKVSDKEKWRQRKRFNYLEREKGFDERSSKSVRD